MKTNRFFSLLATFLLIQCSVVVSADETTHRQAAAELIELTSSDDLFQSSFMLGLEPMMRQLGYEVTP